MPLPDGGRATSVLRLVRVHNGTIAALGVIAGAWWALGRIDPTRTTFAAASALLLAAFANAFNDWHDVEIDRVAHPERPLPRGELSRRTALAIALTCAGAALATSALAWAALAAVSAGVLAIMALYSTHLKRAGAVGNVVVAVLASLPFLYGAWSVGRPRASLALLAVAVPWHLAREIAKDLDDAPADRAVRRTLPVARGPKVARVASVLALATGAFALAPLMAGRALFAALVAPAVVLSVVAALRIARGRPGAASLLKTAMICAMIPLLVTRP